MSNPVSKEETSIKDPLESMILIYENKEVEN